MKQRKVAIVHDWLVGGGAEKVVLELHKMFPEAPIYTSYSTDEWRKKLDGKVVTGYLQRLGLIRKFIPLLRVWWFRSLDLSDFDLVISSSGNGEAKQIRVPSTVKHICYCHTPPHYLWRKFDQYYKVPGFGVLSPLARIGLGLLARPLRKSDYSAAQRVDQFIANSTHIQKDIKKFYGRDSVIIYPPVDVKRFAKYCQPQSKRHGFVTVGRLVPYKRVDLIVDACSQLNLELKVIGKGPELSKLQKRAGTSVSFITNASDDTVGTELGQAKAFIFAAQEDFGITQVEALSAGTPVIAYQSGGALDYVVQNKSGTFFTKQNVESLKTTLSQFNYSHFNAGEISNYTTQFSRNEFVKNFSNLI